MIVVEVGVGYVVLNSIFEVEFIFEDGFVVRISDIV